MSFIALFSKRADNAALATIWSSYVLSHIFIIDVIFVHLFLLHHVILFDGDRSLHVEALVFVILSLLNTLAHCLLLSLIFNWVVWILVLGHKLFLIDVIFCLGN